MFRQLDARCVPPTAGITVGTRQRWRWLMISLQRGQRSPTTQRQTSVALGHRPIAGTRVGRAMCVRLGRMFGHRVPVTVVPCAISVSAVRDGRELRDDADDHLVLVTGRAFVDLGLARCRSAVPDAPAVACAERVVGWPTESTVLFLTVGDVTVRYHLADHTAFRRSPLWRRTNRDWSPILERVGTEIDRLGGSPRLLEAATARRARRSGRPHPRSGRS